MHMILKFFLEWLIDSEKSYPSSNSDEDLANAFMDFFVSKKSPSDVIESGTDDKSLLADCQLNTAAVCPHLSLLVIRKC